GEGGTVGASDGGRIAAFKGVARSPIGNHRVMGMGERFKRGVGPINDTVVFVGEDIPEDILQARIEELTRRIDHIHQKYKAALRLAEQMVTLAADKKSRRYRRCRRQLGREIVRISLIIRELGLTPAESKRLAEGVNKTTDLMRSLERQFSNLEKKIAS